MYSQSEGTELLEKL
uniref:Uncharacterized protein n=1 Tax=Moniliophthora roreri TaxID=221103 RepID=A0A0W0FL41_MONRR